MTISFPLRWEEPSLFAGDMKDGLCGESDGRENLEKKKQRRKKKKGGCEKSKGNEKKGKRLRQIRREAMN